MSDGSHNPDFQAIVDRSGAPMKEAKRYYAMLWLTKQGLDPKTALEYDKGATSTMQSTTSQGLGSMSTPIAGTTMPTPQLMQPTAPPPPPAGGNSDMWAMMQFMIQQQQNQSNMQQFQMQHAKWSNDDSTSCVTQRCVVSRWLVTSNLCNNRRHYFVNHSSEQMTLASAANSWRPLKKR